MQYDNGTFSLQNDCGIIIVHACMQVTVVTQQPSPLVMEVAAKPKNYLALSIVNMLCCCFILGLTALIFSLQVPLCMCMDFITIIIVVYNSYIISCNGLMAWYEGV